MIIKTGHQYLLLFIIFILICFLTIQGNDNAQGEQVPQSKIQQVDPLVDLPVSPFRLLLLSNYRSGTNSKNHL
jgi:hypothetical protein